MKYQKKPVVIEAHQLHFSNRATLAEWIDTLKLAKLSLENQNAELVNRIGQQRRQIVKLVEERNGN